MLPRANRLAKETDFKEVLARGKTIQAKFFTIKYKVREDDGPVRVGIIASKKISKRAVVRNKVRRQVREAVRPFILSLKARDLVFLLRREIVNVKYKQIEGDVRDVLEKL